MSARAVGGVVEIPRGFHHRDRGRGSQDFQPGAEPEVAPDGIVARLYSQNVRAGHQRGICRRSLKFLNPHRRPGIVGRLVEIEKVIDRARIRPRDFHPVDPRDEAVVVVGLQDQRSRQRRLRCRRRKGHSQIQGRRFVEHRRLEIRRHRGAPAKRTRSRCPVSVIKGDSLPGHPRTQPGRTIRHPAQHPLIRCRREFVDDHTLSRGADAKGGESGHEDACQMGGLLH